MSETNVFTAADILAAQQCGEGFSAGYESKWPVDIEMGHRVLSQWPDAKDALEKCCTRPDEAIRWLQGTRLVLEGLVERTPPSTTQDEDYLYKNSDGVLIGRTTIEPYLGEPVPIKLKIPFLRKSRGLCEAVYFCGKRKPMDQREYSRFQMMAAIHEGLFYRITGQNLLSRLVAPQYGTESILDPFVIDLRKKATSLRMGKLRGKTSGYHCNEKAGSTKADVHWRCPIREECAPFESR